MPNIKEMVITGDINKLHSEINQYINQILSVTNQAITIFTTVVLGSTFFGIDHISGDGYLLRPFALVAPFGLLIILMVMFIYCRSIARQHNILSAYLEVNNLSEWEDHYQDYAINNRKLTIQNFYHVHVFQILIISTIVLTVLFCIVLKALSVQTQPSEIINYFSGGFTVLSIFVLLALFKLGGVEDLNKYRKNVIYEWCNLLNKDIPDRYKVNSKKE